MNLKTIDTKLTPEEEALRALAAGVEEGGADTEGAEDGGEEAASSGAARNGEAEDAPNHDTSRDCGESAGEAGDGKAGGAAKPESAYAKARRLRAERAASKEPAQNAAGEQNRRAPGAGAGEAPPAGHGGPEEASRVAESHGQRGRDGSAAEPLSRAGQPAQAEYRDEHGYSALDYENAGKHFEKEGQAPLAEQAREKARLLRHREAEQARLGLRRAVERHISEVIAQRPEFADPRSESGRALSRIIAEHPILGQYPGGLAAAVRVFDAQKTQREARETRARIDKLTAENERLTKLTSIPSSNPARPPGPNRELTGAELRKRAEELDNS